MKQFEILEKSKRGEIKYALIISIFFLLFYVWFQSGSIYGGDAGDLVSAAYTHGVAHPPGYPLYTLLATFLIRIPVSTVAWRVALLSSTTAAISLGLFYILLVKMTKQRLVAGIGVFTLGFSYLFWLYAIVVEVFALHILLSLFIFYFLYNFTESKRIRYFYYACFTFGLAIAHHHTILLLVPAYIFLIFPQRRFVASKNNLIKAGLAFLLGTSTYLYVVFAAHFKPFINWENPDTFAGFIKLFTRNIYGTFRSNAILTLNLSDRLYHFQLFYNSLSLDFSRGGLILAILGLIELYRKDRRLWVVILLGFIFSGPLYLFYAGFPYTTNFQIGTSERFYLLPYIFFIIFVVYGIAAFVSFITRITNKLLKSNNIYHFSIVFIILPLSLLWANYPKLSPLKTDKTAENLAADILLTLPDNAILVVTDDVVSFNTEYVYLVTEAKKNRNLKLLHWGLMDQPFYNTTYVFWYPELQVTLPPQSTSIFNDISSKNFDKFPIYSTSPIDMGSQYRWLPEGILFHLYRKSDRINQKWYTTLNEKLFNTYHDPSVGALGSYSHLLLSEVNRVYAEGRKQVGDIFEIGQQYTLAEKYFQEAMRLQPDDLISGLKLANIYIQKRDCSEAEKTLLQLTAKFTDDPQPLQVMVKLYQDCYKDPTKAEDYRKLLLTKQKSLQTKLKEE